MLETNMQSCTLSQRLHHFPPTLLISSGWFPVCWSWTPAPGYFAIMFFTALHFTSITSHIHNWVLFSLWLHPFIVSGIIYPHFSNSILGIYRPGEFIFQCHIFCLFILFMGFSRQEYWSGLPFPSPVDHVLSELSTMICPSWVALHVMAHNFIELDKAVVHVIRLVSLLWLRFLVCLLSDRG